MRPFNDATRQNIAERCAAFARLEPRDETGLKPAAVAIALVDAGDSSGGTALLLTLRASGLRAHSNQWALPGGRCDAGETPVAAALRELHEELGLELGPGDVLGTAQSGLPALKIGDLKRDANLMRRARAAAMAVFETDPRLELPENQRFRHLIVEQQGQSFSHVS